MKPIDENAVLDPDNEEHQQYFASLSYGEAYGISSNFGTRHISKEKLIPRAGYLKYIVRMMSCGNCLC